MPYGFSDQEASQAHGEKEAPQVASQNSSPAPQQEVVIDFSCDTSE
jgi:hypothetical protein